jgi:hypothetical protein
MIPDTFEAIILLVVVTGAAFIACAILGFFVGGLLGLEIEALAYGSGFGIVGAAVAFYFTFDYILGAA